MVDKYLKSNVEAIEVEEKIELLRKFLEEFDVAKIRSAMENYMEKGFSPHLQLTIDVIGKIQAEIKISA